MSTTGGREGETRLLAALADARVSVSQFDAILSAARADRLAIDDGRSAAVWRFAREFARTSGDSPSCECTNCRAYRAVRDEGGDPS